MNSLTQAQKPRGYWATAYLSLIRGTVPLDKKSFDGHVLTLTAFRKDSPHPIHSQIELNLQKLIDDFFEDYKNLDGEKDLDSRAKLLDSTFMKYLIDIGESSIDPEIQDYVNDIGIYGAFKATHNLELYETKVGEWAKEFLASFLRKETIQYNIEAKRGLTKERARELTDKHTEISGPWYQAYTNGSVSLEQVKLLRKHLKHPELNTKNMQSEMETAFHKFQTLKNEYPEENRNAYQQMIMSNVNIFIQKVNQ